MIKIAISQHNAFSSECLAMMRSSKFARGCVYVGQQSVTTGRTSHVHDFQDVIFRFRYGRQLISAAQKGWTVEPQVLLSHTKFKQRDAIAVGLLFAGTWWW